ncbi:hypothetical protein L228DRAFT_286211 [Xylona heveae TC161]|uniref:Calponin-homology (CH) domain-containing protein n=1 Tax=Xylona heveae (strain CBS 132557 / TC161) TaxID=1328760 RepID=A0A164ZDV9_XYLHT|nr:hypothetical protein L228DRAFT_286211 [Xylona heveae TC161]KZF18978.1 hypothetical protein L228DRAFT_286211 [Xylona heveae TC161]
MASVTSLDRDLRNMRLSKYTPQAANEARDWIEESLGERLPGGDLLEALKSGVALCKLVNLAVGPPGIKFKASPMPFVQMENISHFLHACQVAPLSLPPHDVFLTVDLYEGKDPAQVLQCIGAFSRAAHNLRPQVFKRSIGPKGKNPAMSPQATGSSTGEAGIAGLRKVGPGIGYSSPGSQRSPARAMSPALTGGSNISKTSADGASSPRGVSTWSKKSDEFVTNPAWNIHQYGYMGGASQGNQGVAFGARRQITSPSPAIPSLAEKQRKREQEEQRLRMQAEEAEHKRRFEREAEEERERLAEEKHWEEETVKQRELERQQVAEEQARWREEEERWKKDEERRVKEEREVEQRLENERERKRAGSDARLRGQFLSEYQAERGGRASRSASYDNPELRAERERVRDLERQLEEARDREREYEHDRHKHHHQEHQRHNLQAHDLYLREKEEAERAAHPASHLSAQKDSDEAWRESERDYLRREWSRAQHADPEPAPPAPPVHRSGARSPSFYHRDDEPLQRRSPVPPARPLPNPAATSPPPPSLPSRPLPDPVAYAAANANRNPANPADASSDTTPSSHPANVGPNRTERFLASNPAPAAPKPQSHYPSEIGMTSTSERDAEDARRVASQNKTKAGGWASKSLLEREMERERERQREWEANQAATQEAASKGQREDGSGAGPGQSWDVNQYGFLGGDSQNRGAGGINFGGRRQIIGPRPPR